MSGKGKKRKMDKKDKKEAKKEKDYETSLEFIKLLLQTKAEDFALEKAKKDLPIFVCYKTDRVVDVWKGLVKHNFLSCPVILKEEAKYYGFIDLVDIVKYIIHHFGPSNILGKEKDFWDLVEEEKTFSTKTVADVMTYPLSRRNPFHPVTEGYSALAVLEPLAREEALHRVPVVDQDRQMFNLVTQFQVVTFLRKHLDLLGDKKDKPLKLCKNVFKDVISVSEDSVAIEAFNLMVDKNISGLAILDKDARLHGVLSLSDIKLISYDARLFWRLQQTVKNFVVKLKQEWDAKHERPRTVVMATPENTIAEVITMLADNKVHRIFMVDDVKSKKLVGVVSLKDLLLEIITF